MLVCACLTPAVPTQAQDQQRRNPPRSNNRQQQPQAKPDSKKEQDPPREPLEHPLDQPLALARECQAAYAEVTDYTALFVKQERIDGKLSEPHYIDLKFRREPFSVYLRWRQPNSGREVIYVDGHYEGKLIAHETGLKDAVAGTVELDPRSRRAMKNSRYPITNAGLGNMIDEMISTWTRERRYGEINVKILEGYKVDGRECTGIQIYHPTPRREFRFCLARIFIDNELKLPVRYEGYDWPRRRGGKPELVEAYTYTRLKINPGLSARDFDTRNPQYSFY